MTTTNLAGPIESGLSAALDSLDPEDWSRRDVLIDTEVIAVAVRAALAPVVALHSPAPGWQRHWRDPARALEHGEVFCAGCEVPGVAFRYLKDCPTRKALGLAHDEGVAP